LKKFVIDFYSTGMPKLFASEVIVTDPDSGKSFPATIKVNEPLIYKGIAVYQSSFEDGGSKLKTGRLPDDWHAQLFVSAQRRSQRFHAVEKQRRRRKCRIHDRMVGLPCLQRREYRQPGAGCEVAATLEKKLLNSVDKQLGSAAKNANSKDLKNVGPSVQYKLRDKTGQAREYHSYMQPVRVDGRMCSSPACAIRRTSHSATCVYLLTTMIRSMSGCACAARS
jgi:cytochrome c biogenesis protein